MAAAAFKGSLVFRGPRGSFTRYITVSDVAGAYYVFQDGNAFITLPADGPYYLTDVILSAAGTDTSTASIYANGAATSSVIINSGNITTVLNRQIASSPVGFKPGTTVKFVQAA